MENIIFGHVHRVQTYALRTMTKTIAGYSIGCLSDRAPKYLKGRHSVWNNGFAVIDYDEKGFQVNNIIIKNNSFFIDGKRWV